jgi:hypothetical protein
MLPNTECDGRAKGRLLPEGWHILFSVRIYAGCARYGEMTRFWAPYKSGQP